MAVPPTVMKPGQVAEIRNIAEQSSTQQTLAPRVDSAHVRQFDRALETGKQPTEANLTPQGNISQTTSRPAAAINSTTTEQNLGERILHNLQRASAPMEGKGAMGALEGAGRNSVTGRSAMEAQYKLTVWDLNTELESKVVGKSAQTVQTLLKMQ